MKILPIGSVVKVDEAKYVIAGYHRGEKDNHFKYVYIGANFPNGFENQNSLKLFGFDEVQEVLSEGYLSESGKTYTERLERASENAKEITLDELKAFFTVYQKYVKDKKNKGE